MNELTLYALADEYLQAIERLPEMGLDEQTVADTLEGLTGNVIVKGQNVAAYILNVEAEADKIRRAAEKLVKRAGTLDARMQHLRNYLYANMERTGIHEIKALDGTFTAKIKKNPPAVEVTDPEALPAIYLRTIPEKTEPDKAAIKTALQGGELVPGASLIHRTHLEIKV